MIRITTSKSASAAVAYFNESLQAGDYYTQECTGTWHGLAAERLGLHGAVTAEQFAALCHNRKPGDDSKLNPRENATRRTGYDFTFSVPKSVSIAYAITGDERIREKFEEAVLETMQEIEQNIHTQAGQGKNKHYVKTGEAVWAAFCHKTARPVGGVPDPHLHQHCYLFNTTYHKNHVYKGKHRPRFQALEISPINNIAPYYEAAFHARMADKIQQLGYRIERKVNAKGQRSWELAEIDSPTLLDKFSRRTAQVEKAAIAKQAIREKAAEEMQANGQTGAMPFLDAKRKAELGAKTREKKQSQRPYDQLRATWRSWLNQEESDSILKAHQFPTASEKKKDVSATDVVTQAERHLFERKSVLRTYQLKAEALKRGVGYVLPEEVQLVVSDRMDQGILRQREMNGRHYLTTREAIEEEEKLLAHIRAGRGKYLPLNAHYNPKADFLNKEQRDAIQHVLNDTNNVTIIVGDAGTGKTTLLQEVKDGLEEGGGKLLSFAPSAAARDVLRSEGFNKAETVARLLVDSKLQEQTKDAVILIDEAGLLGTKDMNTVCEIAQKHQARILLTGDIKQHASVARGDALKIMEQDGGLQVARVRKIQRQRHHLGYKAAVRMAADGKVDEALLKLDQMGEVVEIAEGRHRLAMLVTDYTDAVKAGKSALIVSPTHIEGHHVTDTLRQKLKVDGMLDEKQERSFLQLKKTDWTEENKADPVHYQQEDHPLVLEFHQNASGHVRGERWQVIESELAQIHSISAERAGLVEQNMKNEKQIEQIDLKQAERFTVYRQQEIQLAPGDKIRITRNTKTREGTRLANGTFYTVKGFTEDGHIQLHTGKTLDKSNGFIDHGYTVTSHASQGKTFDQVFIAQSSQSFPATSQQQFYVSISRGRERCRVYTDHVKALEEAVKRDGQRMTAREIARVAYDDKILAEQARRKQQYSLPKDRHYDRGKSL